MKHPDVVIVGAGLAGCSLAWHLAADTRVLILEQGDQPGAEASSQNAGMVRRMGEDPAERALSARSFAFYEDPGEDWVDTPPSRRVGAVLGLAWDPFQLHESVAALRAAGVRVECLKQPALVAPALADAPLTAAWYLPDERVADAHALLSGFLGGARRRGAAVRCRSRVTGLMLDKGRVVGLRTESGDVAAGRVVLAAGAWSAHLAAQAGLRRPLMPLRRTLLQSDPHPLSRPDHPWCWIDDVGVYVRPEGGGWLCSPCDEAVDFPDVGADSWGALTDDQRARAVDKLERYLPALADARLARGWTGLRTFAPDRAPVMGPDPEVDGLWWAAGLGGFGVTCSYAIGEAIAEWMRGRAVPWLQRSAVAPGRAMPRRWPIRPQGALTDARLIDAVIPS